MSQVVIGAPAELPRLAREVGLFDATMLVMGGIVGSGIFINPSVVARHLHTPATILAAWLVGGVIALAGAFIYAELAARVPAAGGQYAYLREAFHPLVAFSYGWVVLLVIQTGGIAAVAVTFGIYLVELTGLPLAPKLVAVAALGLLAAVNCFGVRAGSRTQTVLMLVKIGILLALTGGGVWFVLGGGRPPAPAAPAAAADLAAAAASAPPPAAGLGLLAAIATTMVPVLFAYGGWQSSTFIAEEVREPRRTMPRALLLGIGGVIVLYLAVNWVYVEVLGPRGLAATMTPAAAAMESAFGPRGARWMALGVAISTLGFLSQSMLTVPRVYFAMARDGLFFRTVAWIHPRYRVPTVAILLQAAASSVIALSGTYEQILSYVVAMEFLFFGLTASCLFVFRRREKDRPTAAGEPPALRVPGHPVTTVLAIAAGWLIVVNAIVRFPVNTLIGMAILLTGVPVFFLWKRPRRGGGHAGPPPP
jgi:APA family basic amino acid/polyamine antiporter